MSTARQWVRDQLIAIYPHPDDMTGNAVLVTSELVTNSVQAGATSLSLCLDGHRDHVCIATTDDAPGQPVRQQARPELDHGRGLLIVDALATEWGVTDRPAGKTVWADLGFTPGAGPDFDCTL